MNYTSLSRSQAKGNGDGVNNKKGCQKKQFNLISDMLYFSLIQEIFLSCFGVKERDHIEIRTYMYIVDHRMSGYRNGIMFCAFQESAHSIECAAQSRNSQNTSHSIEWHAIQEFTDKGKYASKILNESKTKTKKRQTKTQMD